MNWDKYRREDYSINLTEAHREFNHGVSGNRIREYFEAVESLQPIKSRQVAAGLIVMADVVFMRDCR